jgi:NTE family protein
MSETPPPGGDGRIPVALCLSGGGYAAALFELGAVAALAASLPGWSLSRTARVVGTSAGAVVGALLAFGVDPATVPSVIDAGDGAPLSFRRRDFSRVPWGSHLRSLAGGRVPSGFFSNAGLENLIRRVARGQGREDRFDALKIPLVVVATDLDTGERAVFGPGPGEPTPVSAAVRASGAIPVFFLPVRIGDRDHIDGQIVDPLHLDLAAPPEVRGVIAVSALTPYRRPPGGERVRSLGPAAISDQSARVSAAVKVAAARARLARERPDLPLLMIAPEAEEAGELLAARFDRRFAHRAWRLGYRAASRSLAREGEELASALEGTGIASGPVPPEPHQ